MLFVLSSLASIVGNKLATPEQLSAVLKHEELHIRRLLFEKVMLSRGHPEFEKTGIAARAFLSALGLDPNSASLAELEKFAQEEAFNGMTARSKLLNSEPWFTNNIGPRTQAWKEAPTMNSNSSVPPITLKSPLVNLLAKCNLPQDPTRGVSQALAMQSSSCHVTSAKPTPKVEEKKGLSSSSANGPLLGGIRMCCPENACFAAAPALVLHAAAQRLHVSDPSRLMQQFSEAAFVRRCGVNLFLKGISNFSKGYDASRLLVSTLHTIKVDNNNTRFTEVFGYGPRSPANSSPFAALRHYPDGNGHWSALVKTGNEWFEHLNGSTISLGAKLPKAHFFVWPRERRGGSSCGYCKKSGAEHPSKGTLFSLKCRVCKQTFFGNCTGLRTPAERSLIVDQASWCCLSCSKKEPRTVRPRVAPSPPPVANVPYLCIIQYSFYNVTIY
jgi:hypothetical protein